jgi:hypothetical protein
MIISPDGVALAAGGASPGEIGVTRGDPALVKALGRAFRWRKMLETGVVTSITEIATVEKINRSYVSRVLRLTLLAPSIVEALLDGRPAPEMTLPGLMGPLPASWSEQRVAMSGAPLRSCVGLSIK